MTRFIRINDTVYNIYLMDKIWITFDQTISKYFVYYTYGNDDFLHTLDKYKTFEEANWVLEKMTGCKKNPNYE